MATIYICTNEETICDGYCDGVADAFRESIADRGTEAGFHEAASSGHAISHSSHFADWHGGKYAEQCGREIGGVRYGYATKFVATREENPDAELIDLIDRISAAMIEAIEEAAEYERAETANLDD